METKASFVSLDGQCLLTSSTTRESVCLRLSLSTSCLYLYLCQVCTYSSRKSPFLLAYPKGEWSQVLLDECKKVALFRLLPLESGPTWTDVERHVKREFIGRRPQLETEPEDILVCSLPTLTNLHQE